MSELTVRGGNQLEVVGRRLRATGNGELRKELLRGFREAGKPVIRAIRSSASSELPQSGGLADQVARSSLGVRTRLSGKNIGVRIEGRNSKYRSLRRMDLGTVRHPVFGNGDVWVSQPITPGWFSKPIEHAEGQIRTHMQGVLTDVANKIVGLT